MAGRVPCKWCLDDPVASLSCVCNTPHKCHANGCENPEIHAELPFCEYHFKLLPVEHRNRLWRLRPYGKCGVCDSRSATKEWLELANLGIAIICRLEYGSHGCPSDFLDETGFCWGCGCSDVPHVYEVSERIVRKFGLYVER